MICPHCHKPINKNKHTEELKIKALAYLDQGYTARDVEALLKREVSYATVSRWQRKRESK